MTWIMGLATRPGAGKGRKNGTVKALMPSCYTGRQESQLPELESFAHGVERDKDAVQAGLTLAINNGQVEGQVTRMKLIKRMMYGKAGFALLRQRVLHRI